LPFPNKTPSFSRFWQCVTNTHNLHTTKYIYQDCFYSNICDWVNRGEDIFFNWVGVEQILKGYYYFGRKIIYFGRKLIEKFAVKKLNNLQYLNKKMSIKIFKRIFLQLNYSPIKTFLIIKKYNTYKCRLPLIKFFDFKSLLLIY